MRLIPVAAVAGLTACTGSMGYMPTTMTPQDEQMQKTAFFQNLADPNGAQVQDVRVYAAPNGNRLICGKVNAKNAFGGYTGFQTFEVATVASADYSKPNVRPIFATGPVATIDCGGAGYN